MARVWQQAPTTCPRCGSSRLRPVGAKSRAARDGWREIGPVYCWDCKWRGAVRGRWTED